VPTTWTILGVGDFDGDGHADILWRDAAGNLAVWLMSGGAVVSDVGLGNVPTVWAVAVLGDFDGDGKTDILWRDTTAGTVAIWFLNGPAVVGTGSPGAMPLSWTTPP